MRSTRWAWGVGVVLAAAWATALAGSAKQTETAARELVLSASACPLDEKPANTACRTWSCDLLSGAWVPRNQPDGTTCSDGNACTTLDKCSAGTCRGSNASPQTPCVDLDRCTENDHCNGAGACVSGTPVSVDDSNPCTVDSCVPATGVKHSPAPENTCCGPGGLTITSSCCQNGTPSVSGARACTYTCYDDLGRMTRRTACASGSNCQAACP